MYHIFKSALHGFISLIQVIKDNARNIQDSIPPMPPLPPILNNDEDQQEEVSNIGKMFLFMNCESQLIV